MLPEEYGGKAGPMDAINRNFENQLIAIIERNDMILCVFFYDSRPMVRKIGDLQGLVQGTRKYQSRRIPTSRQAEDTRRSIRNGRFLQTTYHRLNASPSLPIKLN